MCTETDCSKLTPVVPRFACIDTTINISVSDVFATVNWTVFPDGLIIGPNSTISNISTFVPVPNYSSFSYTVNATSGVYSFASPFTVVSPKVALFAQFTQTLCRATGSATLGVFLYGDAALNLGNWSSDGGIFSPPNFLVTVFSWNRTGNVDITFTPNSVCNAPVSLTVQIDSTCLQVLSREATIGIVVGTTLGGLILIVAGVLAAIKLYQVWNRRLVQFRKNDDVAMSQSQYKF
jgi:hypothetical protein